MPGTGVKGALQWRELFEFDQADRFVIQGFKWFVRSLFRDQSCPANVTAANLAPSPLLGGDESPARKPYFPRAGVPRINRRRSRRGMGAGGLGCAICATATFGCR
jgi:hypothetical protein